MAGMVMDILEDFEWAWDEIWASNATASSSKAKYGTQSLFIDHGEEYAQFQLPTARTEQYGSFWVYLVDHAFYAEEHLFFLGDASELDRFEVRVDSGWNISYKIPGGSITGTGFVLPVGQWVQVAWYYKIHASTGAFTLKLNNQTIVDLSSIDTTDSSDLASITRVRFGWDNGQANQGLSFWIDAVRATPTGWPQNVKTARIFPDSDGTQTDFSLSTGSVHYSVLDDSPLDKDTYAYINAAGETEQVGLENLPADVGDIKAVVLQAHLMMEGSPTPTQCKLGLRVGGTDYWKGDRETPTDGLIEECWEESPDTSTDWIVSEINSAEASVESVA